MKMSRFALSDFRLFRLMGAIRQYNVGRWDLGRCCTSCRFSARHRLRRGRRHRRPPRRRRSIVSDGRGVGAGLHKRRRPLVVAVGRTVDGLVRRRGVDFFPRRPPSVDRRRRRRRPHQTLRARPPLAVAVRSDVAPVPKSILRPRSSGTRRSLRKRRRKHKGNRTWRVTKRSTITKEYIQKEQFPIFRVVFFDEAYIDAYELDCLSNVKVLHLVIVSCNFFHLKSQQHRMERHKESSFLEPSSLMSKRNQQSTAARNDSSFEAVR